EIKLHQKSRRLELIYEDESYALDFEFLRVYTPSAEARGHGPRQRACRRGETRSRARSFRLRKSAQGVVISGAA
ncbi:MAG: DUF971 domain-containing protein, partial [Dechloromonas sp.]